MNSIKVDCPAGVDEGKNAYRNPRLLATAVALILAASALPAVAAEGEEVDPVVAALTLPSNLLDLSVGNVSDGSYKFGEYNGLQEKGAFINGGFDLRGSESYDSDSATRWRLQASDLGLNTRSAKGEYGQQGLYRLTFAVTQLRHNISDSYHTPYLGSGTAVQTLPGTWLVPLVPRVSTSSANARGLSSAVTSAQALVSGVLTSPTAAHLTTASNLQAADLGAFQLHPLFTERDRYEAGALFNVSPQWQFTASATRENKSGAKAMGTVTRSTGGDISAILADPIDQTTDQFNLGAAWRGKANFLQLAYYGSRFDNNIRGLTWSNWAQPATSMTMSSAPGNQAHQFSLVAGHDFSTNTRVVANASYGRNTQNQSYLTDASTVLVPVSSLSGEVVSKNFGLRLTSRPQRVVNLSLGFKHDERQNRTPVHVYAYYDANEAAGASNINAAFSTALGTAAGLLKSNANVNANRPYSRKLDQVYADVDFRYADSQVIKASAEWQRIERWCDGTWIACADADRTRETKGGLEWRGTFADSRLNTRLAYGRSQRKVGTYNENAFLAVVPMANVSPSTATGGVSAYSYMVANGLTGYGPVAGYLATTGNANIFFPGNNALANAMYANANRISELGGMRRYNMADRNRDKVRWSADYQAGETVTLQASADYNKDHYTDSRYGLTGAKDWSGNMEATWTPSEQFTATVFYTHEDQRAQTAGNSYTANSSTANVSGFTVVSGGCFATIALRNASNKIDPCTDWATDMHDKVDVLGLNFERSGFLDDKLGLSGEVTYTQARTDNLVAGGSYANNPLAVAGAPAGTIAAYYIPAAALPTVKADALEVRLGMRLTLDEASNVRFTWLYGHYRSTDYAYNGMQFGSLSGVLPTLELAPQYGVHLVALGYSHRF